MTTIFFDTETTGLDPVLDKIIELAAITSSEKEMDSFIRISTELPEFIVNLTGITDKVLENEGLPEETVLGMFFDLFDEEKTVLCAHNAQFDLSFLLEAVKRHPEHPEWLEKLNNAEYLCTLTVFADRKKEHHHLKNAIEYYNLQNECRNSHRAIDDAYSLKRVYEEMIKERDDLSAYINTFAVHPTHELVGEKFSKVRYMVTPERETEMAEIILPDVIPNIA